MKIYHMVSRLSNQNGVFPMEKVRSNIIVALYILIFIFAYYPISYGATVTCTYDNLNRLTKVVYESSEKVPQAQERRASLPAAGRQSFRMRFFLI
jgi:hypothetical protein